MCRCIDESVWYGGSMLQLCMYLYLYVTIVIQLDYYPHSIYTWQTLMRMLAPSTIDYENLFRCGPNLQILGTELRCN